MKTNFEMAFQDYYSHATKGALKKRSDALLKRYDSVDDPRSYSLDKSERSQYILEIVKHKSDGEGSTNGMSQNEMIKKIEELLKELKVGFEYFERELK